jgi:hypothetical protein
MDAGTSREGRLLGKASRIDCHSLDWSLERLTTLYRYPPAWSREKGDNPPKWDPSLLPSLPRNGELGLARVRPSLPESGFASSGAFL